MKPLAGVIPILATPFNDDESLDLKSLARMVTFFLKSGVDGVTVLGVLGEANRLTDSERELILETVAKAVDGRVPIIAGVSHTGTQATIELCRMAERLGADAVMVAPSQQPVPRDQSVFEYFQRIASQTSRPIVVQDHPASTQVHMSVDLLLRLVTEIPSVVCIKAEAVPSPQKIAALKKGISPDRKVTVLTGLGALYGIFDLERGGDGFNTGFAFPEVLSAMMQAQREGRNREVWQIFGRYLPLIVYEQQPGVAIRKEILRLRGLITSNCVRHPATRIDPASAAQLKQLLEFSFPGTDITRILEINP